MIQRHTSFLLSALLPLLLAAACIGKANHPGTGTSFGSTDKMSDTFTVAATENMQKGNQNLSWSSLALLEAGENPIWFELRQDGPQQIESPGAASLSPYLPWPHALFAPDMAVWDGFIVMTINRDGFLALGPTNNSASAMLFHIPANGLWDIYTADTLFIWENKPAILLYQNDFFTEPGDPVLKPQVYTLARESSTPLAVSVPALEIYPLDGLWEADALHRGTGGLWYYRFKEKGVDHGRTAYYRAVDLSSIGERISVSDWRNSDHPEVPKNVPHYFSFFLSKIQAIFDLKEIPTVKVVSPVFEEPRFFLPSQTTAGAGINENPDFVYAYSSEFVSIAILPDGRGFYSHGADQDMLPFMLPRLPEGFAYTGIALLGEILAASWEEQQEAAIGAAGFMVQTLPAK